MHTCWVFGSDVSSYKRMKTAEDIILQIVINLIAYVHKMFESKTFFCIQHIMNLLKQLKVVLRCINHFGAIFLTKASFK